MAKTEKTVTTQQAISKLTPAKKSAIISAVSILVGAFAQGYLEPLKALAALFGW